MSVVDRVHRDALKELQIALAEALGPHEDHCGSECHKNLNGHDCCYICNLAEDMAVAYIRVIPRYKP